MAVASTSHGHGIASVFSAARGALTADPDRLIGQQSNTLRLWLTQVVSGAALPFLILLVPVTLYPTVDAVGATILLLAIVVAGTGFTLARNDHADEAALLIVGAAIIAISAEITNVGLLGNGLDIVHIGLLDWYIVPSVLATLLLRRKASLAVTGCCSALMILEMLALPRTSLLEAFWSQRAPYLHSTPLDLFVLPLALNWLVTAIIHVASLAVRRGMLEAVRADELTQANERIVTQHREITLQREHLQAGVQQIQSVYAAVQRGNLNARIQSPTPELLPLALSFNLLLDRLARLSQENAFYRQMVENERSKSSSGANPHSKQ